MKYKLVSLNVGKPETIQTDKGELESAFRKTPVTRPVFLNRLNFDGDEQADKKNHGGKDKAVCLYPAQHYPHWEKEYGMDFPYPAFGENITVDGIEESSTCIGDKFQLGEAILQVTEPRQPCYIIGRTHGISDFPARVTQSGYTGFYLRVIQEGVITAGDQMQCIEKDPHQVTVEEVNDIKYHDRENKYKIERVTKVGALAEGLRHSLLERLEELETN
ncbi:MOSC domain-containing protein [Halobacillus rhizosphaerae]|uniref:MOSC domain-containing protein n=1 Tax=Halobacillus rhizosphaerae TaxID=3064889 RepID=UPI00398B6BB1